MSPLSSLSSMLYILFCFMDTGNKSNTSPSLSLRYIRIQMKVMAPSNTRFLGRVLDPSSSSMNSLETSMPLNAWIGSTRPSTHCVPRPETDTQTDCWNQSLNSSLRCRILMTVNPDSCRHPTLEVSLSCPLWVSPFDGVR